MFSSIFYSHLSYLDPGSGSALLASLFAVVTALLYSLKILYYKLVGKSVSEQVGSDTLIIFSEGKGYYTTYKPLIDELIARQIHFRYISLDMYDPALTIENEYMHSKLYSRSGLGFAKIAGLKAPLMLSTTPHIGTEGYPLARPQGVEKLVHIFHDYVAGAFYRLGGLDHYDIVISTGEYCREYIERVQEIRNTSKKEIVALGLPYVDSLYASLADYQAREKQADVKTILVAPSWGIKGCLNNYGTGFIKELTARGYRVIVRLHPHSAINEPQNVAQWKAELAHTGVIWDEDMYSTPAMSQADLMISDTSSVRFDFAFLYLKPVITLEIPQDSRADFEASYHDKTWYDHTEREIGVLLEKNNIGSIAETIERVLAEFNSSKLQQIRDENVANFGACAKPIVSYLVEKLKTPQ